MGRVKVSVLVPTKGRPRLLREAIDSLRRQTMPRTDFEVIVANDDPDPLPFDVLTGLSGTVLQGPFGGQSAANNAALRRSSGRYVTVAHDDDLVLETKLAVLGDALDAAPPEVSAVYGLPLYTDAEGEPIERPMTVRAFQEAHPLLTWEAAQVDGCFIHGTATMYRRTALERIGGWDPMLVTAEEFDLHLRLLKEAGPFRAVDAVVVTYRAGGKNERIRRKLLRRDALASIYAKHGRT